jgi:hypothetical protein
MILFGIATVLGAVRITILEGRIRRLEDRISRLEDKTSGRIS